MHFGKDLVILVCAGGFEPEIEWRTQHGPGFLSVCKMREEEGCVLIKKWYASSFWELALICIFFLLGIGCSFK